MHGEARSELSSALSRPTMLDITRGRHVPGLHDVEGIEWATPARIDRVRVQRRIGTERRAFDRQERIVRRFHAKVDVQRARLAARKEENEAVVRFRVAYMGERRARLLAPGMTVRPSSARLPDAERQAAVILIRY